MKTLTLRLLAGASLAPLATAPARAADSPAEKPAALSTNVTTTVTQANVSYLGAVHRETLIDHQLQAELLLYPCTYDELFCITVAEAQVAGAIPVTSQFGAIKTTNEFGIQIEGSPYEPAFVETFVRTTVGLLSDPNLRERQEEMKEKAKKRFALDRILDIWDARVFNG